MIGGAFRRLIEHTWPYAAFAAAWACAYAAFSSIAIPSPVETIKALIEISSAPIFFSTVLRSMTDILIGLSISVVSSSAAVVAAHAVPPAGSAISPFVSLMKSVPIAVIALMLLMIFSSRWISAAAVVLASFPILYTSFLTGIRAADEKVLQMARVFGWSGARTWRYVRLPAAAHHIRSAIAVSSSMAWKAGIAAEIIGAPIGGIGSALLTAKVYLIADELFAWAVVIIFLGRVTEKLSVVAVDALMKCAKAI